MNLKNWNIDTSWTLFLDRDGLINKRLPDDYVKKWDDFTFLPGVLKAIALLSRIFKRIIIVTNQQGIGKGIMTETDLRHIHEQMQKTIRNHDGRIDAIFFCPDLATKKPNCRKPGKALAVKAKEQFPEISFSKSIMAGDMESDVAFARNAGMKAVYCNEEPFHSKKYPVEPDISVDSLLTFARLVMQKN